MILLELLKKLPIQQVLVPLCKYRSQCLVFVVTVTSCWHLWGRTPTVLPATAKPAVVQRDGSLIVAVAPDATAKSKASIPIGAKVERVVRVSLQAKTPVQTITGSVEVSEIRTAMQELKLSDVPRAQTVTEPSATAVPACEITCTQYKPVDLELSIVRLPDNSRRIIATAENGDILSAVDIPVEDAKPAPEPKKWSAGVVGNPFRHTLGVFVDRRYGWLTIGGEIMQRDSLTFPAQINLRAGVNW